MPVRHSSAIRSPRATSATASGVTRPSRRRQPGSSSWRWVWSPRGSCRAIGSRSCPTPAPSGRSSASRRPRPAPSSCPSTQRTPPRNASGCSATRGHGWWSARTRPRSSKVEQVRPELPALEHLFVIDAADGVPSLDELVAQRCRPGPRGAHAPPGRGRDRGHLHDHLHVGHDRPAEGHCADARQCAVGLRQGPSARDHRRGRHALSVSAARARVRAGVAAGRLRAGRDGRLLRRRHPADPAGADRDQADVRAVGAADLREALRRGTQAAGAGLGGGPGTVRQGDRARSRRSATDRSRRGDPGGAPGRRSTRPTSACTSGSAVCSAASSSRRSPAPPRSRPRSSSSSTPAAFR